MHSHSEGSRRLYIHKRGDPFSAWDEPCLVLAADLWEQWYPAVSQVPQNSLAYQFWQHQYGAEAEMELSEAPLVQFESEIRALMSSNDCFSSLGIFLGELASTCAFASRKGWVLTVIAD